MKSKTGSKYKFKHFSKTLMRACMYVILTAGFTDVYDFTIVGNSYKKPEVWLEMK